MSTTLTFENHLMKVSKWNEGAFIPFISQIDILQNNLKSHLAPDDPALVGFGKISTIYPYTQQNCYSRQLSEETVECVKLENDYLRALFIPSLGGRLWSLYDKVAEKELLYVNDVIRPSNLAVRNAWVSGGVEWNIGVIGHSPFTCEQLFVGTLEADGMPVLRMYEYERIRKVVYQMDFFLPEESTFLLCRMRIVNPSSEVVPMYWWSNIAVPELENGRIVVDADAAYTNSNHAVYKVPVPMVNGVDVSYPKHIPMAVDYFFDIPDGHRKYITHLNEKGYGLIHTSTNKLQSRKLFVWGQLPGSDRWQEFLTEKAGRYIEIQAGLAKTQYGCIPMEADSEWEWLEAYGPIQVDPSLLHGDWDMLKRAVSTELDLKVPSHLLENTLTETRESIALVPATLIKKGSPFGALENKRRSLQGEQTFTSHLDFGTVSEDNPWLKLLLEGTLGTLSSLELPDSYMADDFYYIALQQAVLNKDSHNPMTWYHLGLNHLIRYNLQESAEAFEKSITLSENAFNHHALGVAYHLLDNKSQSNEHLLKAISLRNIDVSLVKDCLLVLAQNEAYDAILNVIDKLPTPIKDNGRIQLYKAFCLVCCGNPVLAEDILLQEGALEVEDIREGEYFISDIWDLIQKAKGTNEPLPYKLDFRSIV